MSQDPSAMAVGVPSFIPPGAGATPVFVRARAHSTRTLHPTVLGTGVHVELVELVDRDPRRVQVPWSIIVPCNQER
eukprot:9345335-Lingulodinium_polyedra.AAC.1